MSESKTYSGSCHCGNVRYTAELDLTKPVVSCNCSICSRSGSILAFASTSQFKLESGEEALAEYRFNHRVINHLFCKTCGIKSFSRGKAQDGSDMIAVNVRCLDGVDVSALTVTHYDGKNT